MTFDLPNPGKKSKRKRVSVVSGPDKRSGNRTSANQRVHLSDYQELTR